MPGRASVFLTAVLLVLGGSGAPAHAIANGEDAPADGYPFAVKLTMTGLPDGHGGTRDSSCSGALVAPAWVITAGHCFRTPDNVKVNRTVARTTTATVGRADLAGNAGHDKAVVEVRQNLSTDVALARIDTPITDITPVALSDSPPTKGEVVRLAGFGAVTSDEWNTADHLQVGQFTVTSVSRSYIGMKGRSPRANTSPCPHDSGGPYFVQRDGRATLVSVVSAGPLCPHSSVDQSGRIDTIGDWIRDIIGPVEVPPSSAAAAPTPSAHADAEAVAPGPRADAARAADELVTTWVPRVTTGLGGLLLIGVAAGLLLRRRRRTPADQTVGYRPCGVRRHRA